jgi:hypothetical protein
VGAAEVGMFGQRPRCIESLAAAEDATEALAAPSTDATALLSGSCLRCGLTDMSSPGDCCFHPALLPNPGPLLYSPEWHMCKAGGHTLDMPGCHHRMQHYYMYPVGGLGALEGSSAGAAPCEGGSCSPDASRRLDRLPGGGWSVTLQQTKMQPLVQPKWQSGVVRREFGTAPQPRSKMPSPSPQRRR